MGTKDALPESAEEGSVSPERPSQRPMEVDRSRYYETGELNVGIGADGLPVVAGGAPQESEPGLTEENLVCTGAPGRPACSNYVAMLMPADGVARGFGEMRQIRRFCTRLATAAELFEIDGNIYACSARRPIDPRSLTLIEDFEERQKQVATDAAQTEGEIDF